MSDAFTTFRKFKDAELATAIAAHLEQGQIPFLLEDNHKVFDPNFANTTIDPDISIKLRPRDFVKANKVLEDYYRKSLETVDNDYYMPGFTDQELMEVVTKPQPGHIRPYWMVAAYFLAIFFGFPGLVIGWIMAYFKKTLPDGQRVYAFAGKERNHGKNVMLLGFVSLTLWFVLNSIFGVIDLLRHIV